MIIENIYPSCIQIKYDYIKIDNTYTAGIIISEMVGEIEMLAINNIIPNNMQNKISIYIKKLDLLREVKELSKKITETSSELKSINKNQRDANILEKIYEEATDLRKKIQIENEEIYRINMYILLSDISLEKLKVKIKTTISTLYTNGILAKIANFRHDEVYLSTLPISNESRLHTQMGMKFTTSQLSYLIPYITNNIYDNKGVLYGFIGDSICMYDIFSNNNMNHNMCILGSSGAGKSYFVKMMILRNYCMNIRQIVFDIEGEYISISNGINGIIYDNTNFNLLYIPENFVLKNPERFLAQKIDSIFAILNYILKQKLDKYEKEVKNQIKELYGQFNIEGNKEDMYIYSSINKEYRLYSSFPNQLDLINFLNKDDIIPKKYIKELRNNCLFKKYDITKAERIDYKTDQFIVFDLKDSNVTNIYIYTNYIEQYYEEKLLIYIDELWKVVNSTKDQYIDKIVAELFKTIRKRKAGIIVISQDINDILRYKEGSFGKSILNNSYTKVFFKMQYIELDLLKDIGAYSELDIMKIKKLAKGQAFMTIGDNGFILNIKASPFERDLIEGGNVFEKDVNSD